MEHATHGDAMTRLAQIEGELESFERMRNMPPEHKVTITPYGEQYAAELEAERAEIVKRYAH